MLGGQTVARAGVSSSSRSRRRHRHTDTRPVRRGAVPRDTFPGGPSVARVRAIVLLPVERSTHRYRLRRARKVPALKPASVWSSECRQSFAGVANRFQDLVFESPSCSASVSDRQNGGRQVFRRAAMTSDLQYPLIGLRLRFESPIAAWHRLPMLVRFIHYSLEMRSIMNFYNHGGSTGVYRCRSYT